MTVHLRSLATLAAAVLFAAPAFADGTPGKPVPTPTPGDAPDERALLGGPNTPEAPVQFAEAPAPVLAQDEGLTLNLAGFSGGVGANIVSGSYGGGRVLLVTGGDKRFSGVRSHRAAVYTFGGGKRRGGCAC